MATRTKSSELVPKIHRAITTGKFDSYLDTFAEGIRARQRIIREEEALNNMLKLSDLGTRVRIKRNRIRPQYLAGLRGEVVERPANFAATSNGQTIYVKLDLGRVRRYGPVVGVPAAALEAE